MESDVGDVMSDEPFDSHRPTHPAVLAKSWRGGGLAIHPGSSWRCHCLSRMLLGSIASVDGTSTAEVKVRFTHTPDLSALRGEYGYGASSLSNVLGGGVARAKDAD
jgi:hypothetical protein